MRVDGAVAGGVRADVDMTGALAGTRASYTRFAVLVAGLGLLALTIPTLHWLAAHRESRTQNRALEDAAEAQVGMAREVRHIAELKEWL